MAIYYIDPHTTVNGTGTFASPWSFSTATRTGLVSGDEIRIKGVALTSLLTATTYTATVTNNYQLTITAGGGLGADWAAGDIVYFPAYDTFAKIISSATNVISMYTTYSMWPIQNSTVFGTSISIRKVNISSYPISTTGSAYYFASGANINNITISDCWTDATTRVTDGSVKTLLNSSYTSTMTAFIDTNSSNNYGYSVDLSNTCILNSNSTSSTAYLTVNIYTSNSTVTLGQVFATWINSGGFTIGPSSAPIYNTSITVKHVCLSSYYFAGFYAKSCTFTATNSYVYCQDTMFASGSSLVGSVDCTINFGYIISYVQSYNAGALIYYPSAGQIGPITINYNGMLDIVAASPISYLLYIYGGRLTINYDSVNFSIKYNKRVSTQTSITYNLYVVGNVNGPTAYVPTVNNPTGWSVTYKYYWFGSLIAYTSTSKVKRVPNIFYIDLPEASNYNPPYPYGVSLGTNQLVTYRNGTSPAEILSIYGSGITTAASNANFPLVTRDNAVYRTSGPSLKSYLATRTASYWLSSSGNGNYKTSVATKTIKFPVTSGVAVTVSGYIRTDDAAYVNGDCDVTLNFLDTDVATQAMTTACINNWEQFSLTFTPSQTGEAYLLWDMYYANGAKSYWLDDLVIA